MQVKKLGHWNEGQDFDFICQGKVVGGAEIYTSTGRWLNEIIPTYCVNFDVHTPGYRHPYSKCFKSRKAAEAYIKKYANQFQCIGGKAKIV